MRVLRGRAHQDVEILRRARVAVERDRVTTEHDELRVRVRELDEHVSKVFGQLDHYCLGTKRIGARERG